MDTQSSDVLAYVALFLSLGVVVTNVMYILSTRVWYRWVKIPYIIACLCAFLLYLHVIFIGHPPVNYSRLLNILTYAAMLTGSISSLGRVTNWFCAIRKKKTNDKLPSTKHYEGDDCE